MTTIKQVRELLGDEAQDLLTCQARGFSKVQFHLVQDIYLEKKITVARERYFRKRPKTKIRPLLIFVAANKLWA